ncbi:unnamed protein product [Paramecium sonneborni]|uniref:Uncharacterized protein n=1 Tax=Paramecium sonneborni TaxID=65129 RepID=A0A8S1R0C2_9CILI|nr:unnamed protein product [Paramecium sonneborni]
MSTIEKPIQKLRKLSHEYDFIHNQTQLDSNESFFDEERSQDFQESDLSYQEELPDEWEMSSISSNNSIIPIQTLEKITSFKPQPDIKQPILNIDNIVNERVDDDLVYSKIHNTKFQNGKGIAIQVLGQGSIGKSNKKEKKLEKSNKKQIQNLNNQLKNQNNINNSSNQQSQQQLSSNSNSHSQVTSQQNKSICQSQKFILAYLMVEYDVEKQAKQRALNFIQKFATNINNKQLLSNIQETYKIMLLPDQILQQLAQVLSQEERQQHLNLALQRLNLRNNDHPFAAKAAEKITNHLNKSCC